MQGSGDEGVQLTNTETSMSNKVQLRGSSSANEAAKVGRVVTVQQTFIILTSLI